MGGFSETTLVNDLKLTSIDESEHFKTTNVENTFLSRIRFRLLDTN